MAGVMPTTRGSASAMSHSQLPNTSVYVILPGALAGGVWLSMRSARPEAWLLTGWVATVVGMHVCLAGVLGAWDFVRLAALAWPAALAILALGVGREFPRAAVAAIALTLAAGDLIPDLAMVCAGRALRHPGA